MDFLDFDGRDLYFDAPSSEKVDELIQSASEAYPDEEAEFCLLKSYFLEPSSLYVLVAMYRYYYYQHRYEDAMEVAERALDVSGKQLGYIGSWQDLNMDILGSGVFVSMGLTRFYLLGLKASAYILMRLGDMEGAVDRLEKVREVDPSNQFGAQDLLEIAKRRLREIELDRSGIENVSTLSRYR